MTIPNDPPWNPVVDDTPVPLDGEWPVVEDSRQFEVPFVRCPYCYATLEPDTVIVASDASAVWVMRCPQHHFFTYRDLS